MLTKLNALITFGSSGSVSSVSGAGIQGVTKTGAAGIYELKLVDTYNAIMGFSAAFFSGISGSAVCDGLFCSNVLYQITCVGNTCWSSVGFDSDFTAAVGAPFVACASGCSSHTGQVKAVIPSGCFSVEFAQSQSVLLNNNNASQGKGSAFYFQTLNDNASDAAVIANPVSGSQLHLDIWLKNSSVVAK